MEIGKAYGLIVDSHSQNTCIFGDSLVMSTAWNVTVIKTRADSYKLIISQPTEFQASFEAP
jgi:hypothetical protein